MNFALMSKQRKFILIAAAIGVISVFLPWLTVSVGIIGMSESTNGFHGTGVIVFLAFLSAGILVLRGEQEKALASTMWLVTLCTGAIALLFAGINLLNALNSGGMGLAEAGPGFGIWIALAASIVAVASAWWFKTPGDSLKSGFDSLKRDLSGPANSAPGAGNTPPQSPNNGPTRGSTEGNNRMAELEKLIELKSQGKITDEEYQQLKSKLL